MTERKTLTLKKKPQTDGVSDTNYPRRRRRGPKVEVIVNTKQTAPSFFKNKPKKNKPAKNTNQPPVNKQLKKPRVQTPPQKKKGPSSVPPKERIPITEATMILQSYWPNLFDGEQLKPLQIGILDYLKSDAREKGLPISGKVIKRCLSSLTYRLSYRFTIQAGQPRYDKNGQISGYITEEDELDSKQRIVRTIKQQKSINPLVVNL